LNKMTKAPSLFAALDLQEQELITLVGAGGKTSLMFALAGELQTRSKKVITTTTTKIFQPAPNESPKVILGGIDVLKEMESGLDRHGHVTWAGDAIAGNKLRGVSLSEISAVWTAGIADYMIVEADGSARKPVKAPGEHEPVVPQETTLFVSLLGLSALGNPLNAEIAFRPENISRLTGLAMNSPMTSEILSRLLLHQEGGLKGSHPPMRIVVFLNQYDRLADKQSGLDLAQAVREKSRGSIARIILGQLKPTSKR
jgi:probable selenium-dependent hydroxylase accessory protein YqeC